MSVKFFRLTSSDTALMNEVLDCFSDVFDEQATYKSKRPSRVYLNRLLDSEEFVCLAALEDEHVVGALTAYELKKYEMQRSEMYIYDLAVRKAYRRQGVATGLIEMLKPIAKAKGAWVIFVQADYGDEPAIALYSKMGIKENALHFDISID